MNRSAAKARPGHAQEQAYRRGRRLAAEDRVAMQPVILGEPGRGPDRPPNRAERRAMHNNLRALKVRAARARDAAAKKRKRATPNTRIGVAIRLAGSSYVDGGQPDGHALLRDSAIIGHRERPL